MPSELEWRGDYGHLEPPDNPYHVYDDAYFRKYVGYANTPRGLALNEARLSFVQRHISPTFPLVDIGIGAGQFVESRGEATWGYDVNPAGIQWLLDRSRFWDPWIEPAPAMTFWDSLEHCISPQQYLQRCTGWVFVSIPIFRDKEHALSSRHYRPDEHWWYFTHHGLIEYMARLDFGLAESNMMETTLGREDIKSYAFSRK